MTVDFSTDVEEELKGKPTIPEGTAGAELLARCDEIAAHGGVDQHCVEFNPERWSDLLNVLPAEARRGKVTRAQVRAAARAAIAASRPLDLLAAVYIWGQGRNGYARSRFDRIVTGRGEEVGAKLTTALDRLRTGGPVDAYAQLWGGEGRSKDPSRAAVANPAWSRIDGLGPAFFTKVLYFADPSALILDQVLARRVAKLSSLANLVDKRGRAAAWRPYRYAVYLGWMTTTAQQLTDRASVKVTPDLLELALFRPRGATAREGGAAK